MDADTSRGSAKNKTGAGNDNLSMKETNQTLAKNYSIKC
jgi:hypothetical protein